MGSEMGVQQAASTRKRYSLSGSKPSIGMAAKKVKSTIHLSLEASQRLDVHATMMNLDRSALVEKLVSEHLPRYVVSDRGGAGDALAHHRTGCRIRSSPRSAFVSWAKAVSNAAPGRGATAPRPAKPPSW